MSATQVRPRLEAPGALSDRVGRRRVIVSGLLLQTLGFCWVALNVSVGASYIELALPLLVAGIGISMALPTVPTAVLSAAAPEEMGKASGVNTMMQRFGSVFAVAITTALFSANGHLGSPASVTNGFKPALGVCAALSLLGTLTALGIARGPTAMIADLEPESAPAMAGS